MPGNKRRQRIADQILSGALQAETVPEGLGFIYDVIIAWAKQAPLAEVIAFNEKKLDRERSAELIRQFPARAYLQYWNEDRLRSEPVFSIFFERMADVKYQPSNYPPPPGAQGGLAEEAVPEAGQLLADSLSVEQAITFFADLIVRFAHQVDREKVWEAMNPGRPPADWNGEDAFNEVFVLLYYHILEPMSAHGPFSPSDYPPS